MCGLQRVYCCIGLFVLFADVVAGVSRAFICSVAVCAYVCVCQFVISQAVPK